MYSSLYSITLEGYNRFENNLGTAIHIVNGNIDMSQSSVCFYNNSGLEGGAIALIGQSSMTVGKNRTYIFQNNSALGKGGGLYVHIDDNHGVTASKTCFILYKNNHQPFIPAKDWDVNVSFTGNRAKSNIGHAIFATSLYPCRTINNGTGNDLNLISINASKVFDERGIVIDAGMEDLEGHQIATDGATFDVKCCVHDVIPGQRFAHGVTVKDDLNHETQLLLTVSIVPIDDSNVKLDKAFSSCVGEHIVLKGREGEEAYLHLQTVSSRLSYTKLKVKLIDCPPGFKFDEALDYCVCNVQEYFGLIKCNTRLFHSYISPGVWAGSIRNQKLNKTELVTSYCPLKFCDYNGTEMAGLGIKLPQNYDQLDEAMCGSSRNGIACGNCAQGYTTHFHSPNYACKPVDPTLCKVGWFFYILSELIPVTVVFITVIVLNISFTSGAVNGFILFSQLLSSLRIDANGYITFSPTLTHFTTGYQVMYGVFNFDMFQVEPLSFCLFTSASALDALAIKYITIIYALLLIASVVWCMNRCHAIMRCFGKYCRFTTVKTSVIHGLSAFFILCYSQCLKVSLNLVSGYNLSVRVGSKLELGKRVTLNANIRYFRGKHLLYALPALFCLLTLGALPPVLLLVYPILKKVLAYFGQDQSRLVKYSSRMVPVYRLKPLLDTFECCFRDKLRFFAGVYFMYRWIPLLLGIFFSNFSAFYTALEISIIIILILHMLSQPYTQRIYNVIDGLLFADLAFINAFTFVHYYIFRTTATGRQAVTDFITPSVAVQLVLIYLPLMVATVYTFVVIVRYRCKQNGRQGSPKTTNTAIIKLKDFVSSFRDNDKLEDEALPHRLVAEDIDYECYEGTDHNSNEKDQSDSETDFRDTY